MGFLGLGKRKDFVDLTKYRQSQKKTSQENTSPISQNQTSQSENSASPFGFFDVSTFNNKNTEPENYPFPNETEEKRKKLAKRLMDLTDKIEDLSNQIYHLQQRVELLERKTGVGNF